MSDPETPRQALERILYTKIDAGLYKKDAYEIADAIEALIIDRIGDAFNLLNEAMKAEQVEKRR